MKHFLGRLLTGAAVLAALVACAPTGGQGPFAPSGIPRGQVAVDGLTVGHRLMAAGEYRLALDAYIRAAVDRGLTVDVLSAIGLGALAWLNKYCAGPSRPIRNSFRPGTTLAWC